MKLQYQLSENDFLTYHLYASAHSEVHRKNRIRSRYLLAVLYAGFAFYMYISKQNLSGAIIFLALAAVWVVIYPYYSYWRYKKHFQRIIRVKNQNTIGQDIEMDFQPNSIYSKDKFSEGTFNINEVKDLIELKEQYLIRLSAGSSLILPKNAVDDEEAFKKQLIDYGALYIDDRNWEWK